MAFFLMLLPYRSCRHFFGPVAIAARFLRVLLDMFVLALLFFVHARQRLFLWHSPELLCLESSSTCSERTAKRFASPVPVARSFQAKRGCGRSKQQRKVGKKRAATISPGRSYQR